MNLVLLDFSLAPDEGAIEFSLAICILLFIANLWILQVRLSKTARWFTFSFLFLMMFFGEVVLLWFLAVASEWRMMGQFILLVVLTFYYFPLLGIGVILFLFFSSGILRSFVQGTVSENNDTEDPDENKDK